MDVVLYPRVSDPKQAKKGLSMPEQIREMKAYCWERGHNILKVYEGEVASARDDRRPIFREMIEELLSGTIKAKGIVVFSRSRFFRDFVKAHYYEERLKKRGIQVISLTMPTENLEAPFANAWKNFEYMVSQMQSDLIALHTLGGMKANARKGYFNGGVPPFGYRTRKEEDERGNAKSVLEISPLEAEIVRYIFRLYTQEGRGAKAIASLLNAEELRTRQRGKWTKDNVGAILLNPTYKGERIYNRYESKTKIEKPKDQWIKLKADPVVEKEVFGEAQRIRKENSPKKTNPAVTASRTLLGGLLRHVCGRSMSLETGKSGKYPYYNCRGYLREGSCPGERIRVEVMDNEILDHLTSKFFSVKRLRLLVRRWLAERQGKKDEKRHEETRIRSQTREEKRKLENIYRLIEERKLKEGNINERIEERRRNISLLEGKLTQLSKMAEVPMASCLLSIPSLQNFQRRLKQGLYQNAGLARKYLKLFVERIEVDGEKITIIARQDILLRAISADSGDSFDLVPTAGVEWLPEPDIIRTHPQ